MKGKLKNIILKVLKNLKISLTFKYSFVFTSLIILKIYLFQTVNVSRDYYKKALKKERKMKWLKSDVAEEIVWKKPVKILLKDDFVVIIEKRASVRFQLLLLCRT